MTDRIYQVDGMSCEHCVSAVSGEIGRLAGVESVAVELASGQVTITGDGYTDEQVRDAVDEAGYQLANGSLS
ncbi:MAG: heavy-metal-associated domain-containing protein [Jatrophihabitantaceae bacterium]